MFLKCHYFDVDVKKKKNAPRYFNEKKNIGFKKLCKIDVKRIYYILIQGKLFYYFYLIYFKIVYKKKITR